MATLSADTVLILGHTLRLQQVFLAAEPILETLLPLQIVLHKTFNIHSKIITETENLIKTYLKEGAGDACDAFLLEKNKHGAECMLTRGQGACSCALA